MVKAIRPYIRSFVLFFLIFVCFFHFSISVFAVPTFYFLDVPVVGQAPKQNWCWVACGTAVVNYYGNSISKNDFSIAAVGNATHDDPKSMAVVQAGLQHWSLSSTYVNSSLSFSSIKTQIYAEHPSIAGRIYYEYIPSIGEGVLFGHMFVVTGYSELYTGEQIVEVMNPGGSGALEYYEHSEFCALSGTNSYSWWAESLKSIH